jgi:hypothetical protein
MRIVGPLVLLAWRNWQTRTAQDRMGQPVEVRVLSRAELLLSRWHLVNELLLEQKAKTAGTARHQFESTDLPACSFPSCRPPSFHQLGKPSSSGRGYSAFLGAGTFRRCFLAGLYPCPPSSGGSCKFGAGRSRHRAAAPSGGCRACTGTSQD